MKLFDEKFAKNAKSYILQSILAVTAIMITMKVLDVFTQTTIIASIGASSFILFTMPKKDSSRPRRVIGGYFVGVFCGCLCSNLAQLPDFIQLVQTARHAIIISAGLAAGWAIFIMVITDTEHPPAASVAMGFVLNEWHNWTVVLVLFGIILLTLISLALKPYMKDLI